MADEPSTASIWDDAIKYEVAESDTETKALRTVIESGLAKFRRHRDALLAILRGGYDLHIKSAPVVVDRTKSSTFDSDSTWRRLEGIAHYHLHYEWMRRRFTKPADRQERLRDIAKVLGRAHHMVNETMQTDVGDDLISTWWQGTSEYAEADGRFVDLLYIQFEFEKIVTGLDALQTAAERAADDVSTKRGRPKGTAIVRRDYIEVLAAVYRDKTGAHPGAGDGPFARFVMEFLNAVGRGNIEYESVIDAIKDARRWALGRPAATRPGPSPFDSEFGQ